VLSDVHCQRLLRFFAPPPSVFAPFFVPHCYPPPVSAPLYAPQCCPPLASACLTAVRRRRPLRSSYFGCIRCQKLLRFFVPHCSPSMFAPFFSLTAIRRQCLLRLFVPHCHCYPPSVSAPFFGPHCYQPSASAPLRASVLSTVSDCSVVPQRCPPSASVPLFMPVVVCFVFLCLSSVHHQSTRQCCSIIHALVPYCPPLVIAPFFVLQWLLSIISWKRRRLTSYSYYLTMRAMVSLFLTLVVVGDGLALGCIALLIAPLCSSEKGCLYRVTGVGLCSCKPAPAPRYSFRYARSQLSVVIHA